MTVREQRYVSVIMLILIALCVLLFVLAYINGQQEKYMREHPNTGIIMMGMIQQLGGDTMSGKQFPLFSSCLKNKKPSTLLTVQHRRDNQHHDRVTSFSGNRRTNITSLTLS